MYETEANRTVGPASRIPADVQARFRELVGVVEGRTTLNWGEHCTECAVPHCYQTCEFYDPRIDRKCRRFVNGIVRVEGLESLTAHPIMVAFKKWGQLWAIGNTQVCSVEHAKAVERRDARIGTVVNLVPLTWGIKRQVIIKRHSWKKRMAQRALRRRGDPNCFLIECYNPNDGAIQLSVTLRPSVGDQRIPFQELVALAPGFTRHRIDFDRIRRKVNTDQPFGVALTPNNVAEGTVLYFGAINFVRDPSYSPPKSEPAAKVKCVVWDLDNTLWDGILVEDGEDALRLKPGVAAILHCLDERGILHSIASKNNAGEVLAVLARFGLDKYFLCPQISWGPKSSAIRAIAEQLNIDKNSLLFIDDSPFERAEVGLAHPDVRLFDPAEYEALLSHPALQVVVTDDSRNRRRMYQEQVARQVLQADSSGDYDEFLRDCRIRLEILPLSEEHLDRAYELAQRTNQMNFSGNRYSREQLEGILSDRAIQAFILRCEDRFGSYGFVGLSVIEKTRPMMTDLMFSCRIQAKRVEHAFMSFVLDRYRERGDADFFVRYRPTERNAPSARVFDDFGFEKVSEEGEFHLLRFDRTLDIPDDHIIETSFVEESPRCLA